MIVVELIMSKNDLINDFYYYDDSLSRQLQQANVNNSTLRVRLSVRGDKACYLATGLRETDFEMESLVRERAGVWRGLHSNRYFTQPTLNSLVVYASETDKSAEYVNKSIKSSDIRDAIAQFAARSIKVENIVRLTLPRAIEAVYRDTCLNFEPIYFRGKLLKIENDSEIKKIETSLNEMSADTSISPPIQMTQAG